MPRAVRRDWLTHCMLGACVLVALFAGEYRASAQSAEPAASQVVTADITGRDFAGMRVAATVQNGDVRVSAARAWVWPEAGGALEVGPDGLPIGTQRMLVQGDVRVVVGEYVFSAAQAVLWVQTIGPGSGADPDRAVRQFAIHFDRVSDPGAQAGFAQAADRLLVTAQLNGLFMMRTDAVTSGRPIDGPGANFVRESEMRFARYLRTLSTPDGKPGAAIPFAESPGVLSGDLVPGRSQPYEPNSPILKQTEGAFAETRTSTSAQQIDPLFTRDGVVTFAVGTRSTTAPVAPDFGEPVGNTEFIRLLRGEQDNTLLLTGGVAVQYTDLRKSRNLLITAERAVVFLSPGPLADMFRLGVTQIRGIYLEGDVVATDGQYTLRGPRVFYDFQQNKAIMAEAVFSTVDARLGIPIYVRARSLKQESANTVIAEGARLSTSSFFEPVFSVGGSSITVTQQAGGEDGTERERTFVDTRSMTLRLGGVPFFWLPGFKGEVTDIPLEDIRLENSNGSGTALKTTWNVFGLLGIDRPDGLKVGALIDYFFDRGFALGTDTKWERNGLDGRIFGYMLPEDTGEDVLSSGVRKDADNEFRGMILAENRWDITQHWALLTEFGYISDDTFVDAFFKDLGRNGREITTDAYLRYIGGNQQFNALAKGTLNDFISNQYLLQSQGYSVDKMPEFSYSRLADDILPGVQPGLLTWTHEYRVSRMRFAFDESTASSIGYLTDFRAQQALGINANQSPADRLKAMGLNEDYVGRADTRQELAATLDFEPVKIVPFVVGRFTYYDKTVGDMNALAGPDSRDDDYRLWYSAGSRFSTTLTRIDDDMESSLFDLHRVRHVIEPNATVWFGGTTVSQESLPVYDDTVESLNSGTTARVGVNQTFQTQRGGPGRWRSVDVLKFNTDLTLSTADANELSPIGRFNESRPEYSFLGNFLTTDVAWQATDAVGLIFNQVFSFEDNQQARTIAGGVIQHSPEFSTFGQVRYVNALNSTYVDAGINYQLTRKYFVGMSVTYNADEDNLQNVGLSVRRRFPEAILGVKVDYDNLLDETSFGVIFQPQAFQQDERSVRLQSLSR